MFERGLRGEIKSMVFVSVFSEYNKCAKSICLVELYAPPRANTKEVTVKVKT